MAQRSSWTWPAISLIAGILILIVSLPSSWKGWAPSFLRSPGFHFGLDLAGGTQLDFRISEAEIEKQLQALDKRIAENDAQDGGSEKAALLQNERRVVQEQQQNIVEAIRLVLERRINALGVSEATITPSYIGGEKHLLVECPGVVDVQKCIETVGKTIQLEFKEEFTEATDEYAKEVRARAAASLEKVRTGNTTLQVLGQDMGSQLGIGYNDGTAFFRDRLPKGLESLWTAAQGTTQLKEGGIPQQVQDDQGNTKEETLPGIFLAQVLEPRTMTGRVINDAPTAFALLEKNETQTTYTLLRDKPIDDQPARVISTLRGMRAGEMRVAEMEDGSARLLFLRLLTPGREEVAASHILVAYKGATGAAADVSRTKEQALQRANDLKARLASGAKFEDLARRESDGESRQNAGSLGTFPRGALVPAFEQVAFTAPVGQISDPVETPFGFHLIRVDSPPRQTKDIVSFDMLTVTGVNAIARANGMLSRMQTGKLTRQEEQIRLRFLFFSLKPTGWKDTALDGKHFRTASVASDPSLNLPVVQIAFDAEGAKLFQELTKKNVGKRIAIFVGGELVSAPTVQQEIAGGTAVITGSSTFEEARTLAQDLNTGAIPAPIYLSGQRTVEATLGAQALWTSLKAAFVGSVILILYLIGVYRLLGVIAAAALVIYAILFAAILKLPLFLFSSQYIVLTLAGTAGMILSIGLAVDTNVLVFERVKEELRKGKILRTAIDTGFVRAWPSIRDSNMSTLITCGLLFLVGTSIVRGFAITLGMGVIISMFTGMIITKRIARWVAGLPLARHPNLFIPSARASTPSTPADNGSGF